MNFVCIADETTVRGFRLAGIEGRAVKTPADAVATLHAAVSKDSAAIIILSEQVAAWIPQEIQALRLHRDQPLLIEIPGPAGPAPGRKSLRQFVEEAVGISLRKQEP